MQMKEGENIYSTDYILKSLFHIPLKCLQTNL